MWIYTQTILCVPIATMFSLKNTAEEGMEGDDDEEEDDFQTDEEEEMEVDKQTLQKRKKVSENWTFLNSCHELNSYELNYLIAVIFMSFRSRLAVFRRN